MDTDFRTFAEAYDTPVIIGLKAAFSTFRNKSFHHRKP